MYNGETRPCSKFDPPVSHQPHRNELSAPPALFSWARVISVIPSSNIDPSMRRRRTPRSERRSTSEWSVAVAQSLLDRVRLWRWQFRSGPYVPPPPVASEYASGRTRTRKRVKSVCSVGPLDSTAFGTNSPEIVTS